MVQTGTSAPFPIIVKATPGRAVEAPSKYGGTVLNSSLSKEVEAELQEAQHGEPAVPAGN